MQFKSRLCTAALILLSMAGTVAASQVEFEKSYRIQGNTATVILRVDAGQVRIEKNDDADECYVMLSYDEDQAHCDVTFKDNRDRLQITLDHENWEAIKDNNKFRKTSVLIRLPGSRQIDLETKVKAGEIDFELGDLKLLNLDFTCWAGEVVVNFEEPNRIAMENFDVNVKIGDVTLRNLGNTNAENIDINGGIGEMKLDFRGDQLQRMLANIDLDIGETRIIIPEDIGAKLRVSRFLFLSDVSYPNWFEKKGNYYYSENYTETGRSLYLMISQGIGELQIEVR